MDSVFDPAENAPSSDTDTIIFFPSELSTPLTQSGRTSPTAIGVEYIDQSIVHPKTKKKKKKSKKSGKSANAAEKAKATDDSNAELDRPPVLCISRNKHWRYISSYHGPWLQLPLELLDSLLSLNLDPATLNGPEIRPPSLLPLSSHSYYRQRERGFPSLGDYSPPESPRTAFGQLPLHSAYPVPKPGKSAPFPIDPGVFRSVKNIRGLIDDAAALSVRASSRLSAAELGSMRSGSTPNANPWANTQSLGPGNSSGGGRSTTISRNRIHLFRALAVQKLAQAYKIDEIASSVMVMQGGSMFDDLAERVLKNEPNNADARYVHFFHEKIPSRQLAESTTTDVLDDLIAAHPQCLEYYRTRGIVHSFREEFAEAIRDFTYALKETRSLRKAKAMHHHKTASHNEPRSSKHGKRRKGGSSARVNGQAPLNGTNALEDEADGSEGEILSKHPSASEDGPEPIEPQLLFLRGAAYLQQAVYMIETEILQLEDIERPSSVDGAEVRLSNIENGRFGGVEIGNPDGPLGSGAKLAAYASTLGEQAYRDYITQILKKALRDHEKFLSHFDCVESNHNLPDGDLAYQAEHAFLLSESVRPGNQSKTTPPIQSPPAIFTTYHPLLVESYYSILICQLMLADFPALLSTFIRTALTVDGLEGYPLFLPPRSMAQAEFIEVLERLAAGWRNGIQPHSLSAQRGKSRLTIEGPQLDLSPSSLAESVGNEHNQGPGSSSSSSGPNTMSDPAFHTNSMSSNSSDSVASANQKLEKDGNSRLRSDASEALDCARILLAPVAKRQRERAELLAAGKLAAGGKNPIPINIPLHGPRVEVILAWLGAVHLPELGHA